LEFKNKILFVGYGAVAQCALPILVKHLKTPYSISPSWISKTAATCWRPG